MRRALLTVAVVAWCMPADGRAQHDHDHDAPAVHSHRGPGPHFIDGFYTENAYFERKFRPDVSFAGGDEGERTTLHVEVEWALRRGLSVIVHAPAHRVAPADAAAESGIGDVSFGPKLAIVNDPRALIVSVGADVTAPTGSAARGLGEGHWTAAPFLLAWIPLGGERRWLVQAAAHADLPLEDGGETHGELSAALSWTSSLGVTPMLEVITEVPFEGDERASWAVAPAVRWEFAAAWEVGASVRVALGQPREDVRVGIGVIRHFATPR